MAPPRRRRSKRQRAQRRGLTAEDFDHLRLKDIQALVAAKGWLAPTRKLSERQSWVKVLLENDADPKRYTRSYVQALHDDSVRFECLLLRLAWPLASRHAPVLHAFGASLGTDCLNPLVGVNTVLFTAASACLLASVQLACFMACFVTGFLLGCLDVRCLGSR